MKSQLIASLIAGGALFAVAYIITRKHAIALISALSIVCVPVVWFGSFLYPISSKRVNTCHSSDSHFWYCRACFVCLFQNFEVDK